MALYVLGTSRNVALVRIDARIARGQRGCQLQIDLVRNTRDSPLRHTDAGIFIAAVAGQHFAIVGQCERNLKHAES